MNNRNDAFSLEIVDPDFPENNTPLVKALNIGDDLILFKTDGIYRLLTAETIDPESNHPKTSHTYEKIYPIGTESNYVSRIIIQFEEIIKFVKIKDKTTPEFIQIIWESNKLLLNSLNSIVKVYFSVSELSPKCDDIIQKFKGKPTIPPIPKVPELENHVRIFFNNAKLFLIEIFRLLHTFYGLPFNGRNAAHFSNHLIWLEKNLGSSHQITELIQQDMEWIRLISESRNALEHPEEGQKIEIFNIRLMPDNKFALPSWSYDLSKKLEKTQGQTDLINDFDVLLHNMLHLYEDILLISSSENFISEIVSLYKLKEQAISKKCPVQYKVILNPEFSNNEK